MRTLRRCLIAGGLAWFVFVHGPNRTLGLFPLLIGIALVVRPPTLTLEWVRMDRKEQQECRRTYGWERLLRYRILGVCPQCTNHHSTHKFDCSFAHDMAAAIVDARSHASLVRSFASWLGWKLMGFPTGIDKPWYPLLKYGPYRWGAALTSWASKPTD